MLDHFPVTIQQEDIVDFCQRHHIQQLAIFGSALRDDFRSGSDIDVLVRFHPDHIPGLAFFGMQAELSEILGHPVDLNTLQFISPEFRQQVVEEAEIVYDQT